MYVSNSQCLQSIYMSIQLKELKKQLQKYFQKNQKFILKK